MLASSGWRCSGRGSACKPKAIFQLLNQDSKAQVTAIHLIVGTLQRMLVFGIENMDTLTHKATGVRTINAFLLNPASDAFFASTLRYIRSQKQKGGSMGNGGCDYEFHKELQVSGEEAHRASVQNL
ncbi:unnamed protein product [Linum tenue]|uniref:Uncharacterized protein n=1 Tax=Linum tenue TaxID=586396 RepID=A0AAV0PXM5_9ROSI|nr:unnamed protein product [Linum tenue]